MYTTKSTLLILGVFMCALYVIPVVLFGFDAPFRFDDFNSFVLQFENYFLDQETILSKLKYFVRVTLYPHPQIGVRICSLLSYLLLGKIDFYFLNILGSLFLPIFFLLLIFFERLRSLIEVAIVGSIILVPVAGTIFWKVSIVGSGFGLISVYLCLYFRSKEKLLASTFWAFIALFSGGTGFLSIFLSFCFFRMSEFKTRTRIFLLHYGALFLFLLIFYFVNFSAVQSKTDAFVGLKDQGNLLLEISQKLLIFLITSGQAFSSHLPIAGTPYSILPGVIVFSGVLLALYIYRNNLRKVKLEIVFWIYSLLTILIASVLRFAVVEWDEIWSSSIPRYEPISSIYLCASFLLVFRVVDSSFKCQSKYSKLAILATICMVGLGFFRYERNLSLMKILNRYSDNFMIMHLMDYESDPTFNIHLRNTLLGAISSDLYKPDTDWFIDEKEMILEQKLRDYITLEIDKTIYFDRIKIEDNLLIMKVEILIDPSIVHNPSVLLVSKALQLELPIECFGSDLIASGHFLRLDVNSQSITSFALVSDLNDSKLELGQYEIILKYDEGDISKLFRIPYKIDIVAD